MISTELLHFDFFLNIQNFTIILTIILTSKLSLWQFEKIQFNFNINFFFFKFQHVSWQTDSVLNILTLISSIHLILHSSS